MLRKLLITYFGAVVVSLLVATPTVHAGAKTVDEIHLRSLYRLYSGGAWGNQILWTLRPSGAGEISVSRNDLENPDYRLNYDAAQRLTRVYKMEFNAKGEETPTPIELTVAGQYVLSDGLPFPFDDLNPDNEMDDQTVLKKSAGGLPFAFKVKRRVTPITAEAARDEGMLAGSSARVVPAQRLLMISMIKNDQLMVRQLWIPGESWWRYEETPFRRSWRME